MEAEVIKAIIMLLFFIALLVAITIAGGRKAKTLIEILNDGAKKELTTVPGWISLAAVILMAVTSIIFVCFHEAIKIFDYIFALNHDGETFPFSIGIFAVLGALILDFIFVAIMDRGSS